MNTIRWIIILPISITCSIIFPYLYQLLVEIFIEENTFADSFFLNGTNFILQGIFYIVPVYFLAPKYKSQTLKLFLILWIVIVIVGDYYLYYTNRENVGVWNSLLRIIGALLAYINIVLEHKNEIIDLSNENNEKTKQEKIIKLTQTENQKPNLDWTFENLSKNQLGMLKFQMKKKNQQKENK